MGDMVGEIAYGVLISKEDYQRLFKELYSERQQIRDGIPQFYSGYTGNKVVKSKRPVMEHFEKDPKSIITIDQPYETEDYLIIIRSSQQSSYNGVTPIKIQKGKNWDNLLRKFFTKHKIKPQEKNSWLLIGRYN